MKFKIAKLFYIFVCFALAAFILPDASFSEENPTVAVLLSRPIQPYKDALSGFKEKLASNGYRPVYTEFNLKQFAKDKNKLINDLKDLKPDLTYTVGTEASLFAKDNLPNFPVVFSMVLGPVENNIVRSLTRPGGNITGVSLDIPIEKQFRELKRVLPHIKSIGMLYDKKEKSDMEREARNAARGAGIKLVSKPVYSEKDISAVLDEVFEEADCLWAGVDP